MKDVKKEILHQMFGGDKLNDVAITLKSDLQHAKSKGDIAKLLPKYLFYVYFDRPIDTAVNTFYTLKTILKEIGTKKAQTMDEMLTLPHAISNYRNRKYEKEQLEKAKKDEQNIDIDYILSKTKELLENIDNDNYLAQYVNTRQSIEDIKAYAKMAIIALYTGRRMNEILNTVSFHRHGDKVYMQGLLKKHGTENKEYELCLFEDIDIKTLQKFLRDIRRYFNVDEVKAKASTVTRQNQLLNKKFNYIVNNNIRKIYGIDNLTLHDFRAIYAELCFRQSGEKVENKNEFIAKVLGHTNTVTQTAYKNRAKGV